MKREILIISLITLSLHANTQNLKNTILETLNTNPTILERLKNYNLAKQDIDIAKADYYPKLDFSFGMGIETTEKSDSPVTDDSSKTFDIYQTSLKYTQNLFKGFQTENQIKEQENRTLSSAYSYIEQVNSISFNIVQNYIKIMRQKELLSIKKENVVIDEDIFLKVQKLYDSGLTNLSEVNKIESSLALAKSDEVVQENTFLDATYNMKKDLGHYPNIETMSKPDLDITLPKSLNEAILYAIENNPSLLVSDYNIKLAKASYKSALSSLYPQIDVEVSQAINNNLNGVENKNSVFKAMVFLKYNIFDGFRNSASIQKGISKIHLEIQSKNSLRDQVIEELSLAWIAYEKLTEQLVHLQKYKDFSFQTLTLYSKEYDLGRRSLLDLLSSQNDFIGAKSQIINANYDILFAKYRILNSLGTLLTTIIGDTDIIYSNVNLSAKNNQIDSFPISLDSDNDLINNDNDICRNSLSLDIKDSYGCKFSDNKIVQIERYSDFLFPKENNISEEYLSNLENITPQFHRDMLKENNITKETKFKIESLIHQLKPYGLENLKIAIYGNATYDNLSKKELLELSKKRANHVKNLFLENNMSESNIEIYSNSDNSKRFFNDEKLNNRVDIIVKKMKLKK